MQNPPIIKPWHKNIPDDWTSEELHKLCSINKWEQLNKSNLNKLWDFPSYSWWRNPSWYTNNWNTEKKYYYYKWMR